MNKDLLLIYMIFLKYRAYRNFRLSNDKIARELGVSSSKAISVICSLVNEGWLVRRVCRNEGKGRPRYTYFWKEGLEILFHDSFDQCYPPAENGRYIFQLLTAVSSQERYFSINELTVLIELIRKSQPLGYIFGVGLTDLSESSGLAINTIRKAIDGLTNQGALKVIKSPKKASIFKHATNLYVLNFNHICFAAFRPNIVEYTLTDQVLDQQNEAAEYVLLYRKAQNFKSLIGRCQKHSEMLKRRRINQKKQPLTTYRYSWPSRSSMRLKDEFGSLQFDIKELTSVNMESQYVSEIFGDSASVPYIQAILHFYASILLTHHWNDIDEDSIIEKIKDLIAAEISIDRVRIKIRTRADAKSKILSGQVIQQVSFLIKLIAQRVKGFLDQVVRYQAGASYYIHPLESYSGFNLRLRVTFIDPSSLKFPIKFHVNRVEPGKYEVLT